MSQNKLADQKGWDEHGRVRLAAIEREPDHYLIDECPKHRAALPDIFRIIGDHSEKKILDTGCGRGEFSIWLAKNGAKVSAIDVGPSLIAAARAQAAVNDVSCDFGVGDIRDLPYSDEEFDVVLAIATLHHLSEEDVIAAVAECKRVLKPGGLLLAYEPVENSKVFDFLQNLVPAGRPGNKEYRPSILMRKRWAEYLKRRDDRPMTSRELVEVGSPFFNDIEFSHYGLLVRLARVLGDRHESWLHRLDDVLLQRVPSLRRYCQSVLVKYTK